MNDQWFVHSNGQETGPYTGEQLVEYAGAGSITAETLVWMEGMPEWLPASQIEGLLPAAPAASWAPTGESERVSTGGAPYTSPASSLAPQAAAGEYPYIAVKPASFGLWLGTFLGGFLAFLIGLIAMIAGYASASEASAAAESAEVAMPRSAALGMVFIVLGWAAFLMSAIFFYINLYRAWSCLQAGAPRTTAGKSVGFLFIPFFNFYWMFVAFAGLPKDWNRIVAAYENLNAAPKLNETVFLLFCIGTLVFPPLALIVIFPVVSQMCKGINFFAARRNPNTPSVFSALGGR